MATPENARPGTISRQRPGHAGRARGFTLVELVVVIVLTGILGAVAAPRFFERKVFDARGFFDQTATMLRYAQKVAIAQHRDVFVNLDAGTGTICLSYVADAACTNAAQGLVNPADQQRFLKTAPAGSAFGASASLSFSALGRPAPNSTTVVSVSGGGLTRTITVEQETGYVH